MSAVTPVTGVRGRVLEALAPLIVPLATLREDPENVRAHPGPSVDAMVASLEAFGQVKPVVRRADGTVIAGNATLRAARILGWTHLAALTTDLTGDDAAAFAVADNRSAEFATWDRARLAEIISELRQEDAALALSVGFTNDQLDQLEEAHRVLSSALETASGHEPVPPGPDPLDDAGERHEDDDEEDDEVSSIILELSTPADGVRWRRFVADVQEQVGAHEYLGSAIAQYLETKAGSEGPDANDD